MVVTTKRRKIEILVDTPLLRRIRQLADDIGLPGYTLFRTLGGEGGQGRWRDDQVTGGAGSKVLFTTIVDEAHADALVDALTPFLDEYGLIMTISTVEVVRPDRF